MGRVFDAARGVREHGGAAAGGVGVVGLRMLSDFPPQPPGAGFDDDDQVCMGKRMCMYVGVCVLCVYCAFVAVCTLCKAWMKKGCR